MTQITIQVLDRDKIEQLQHVISHLMKKYEDHPDYYGDDCVAEADDLLKMLDGQCIECGGIFESLKQYYKNGLCPKCTLL